MRYFRDIHEHKELLLLEAHKLKEAKKKYLLMDDDKPGDKKKKLDKETFDQIRERDPSRTKKYVYWVCREIIENKGHLDHLFDQIAWHTQLYAKLTPTEKDIENFTTAEIDDMIADPAYLTRGDKKKMAKSKIEHENYVTEYQDDNIQIVRLKNQYGAEYWTHTTEDGLPDCGFCVGSRGAGNQYSNYMKGGDKSMWALIFRNETGQKKKVILTPLMIGYGYTDVPNSTETPQTKISITGTGVTTIKNEHNSKIRKWLIRSYPVVSEYIPEVIDINIKREKFANYIKLINDVDVISEIILQNDTYGSNFVIKNIIFSKITLDYNSNFAGIIDTTGSYNRNFKIGKGVIDVGKNLSNYKNLIPIITEQFNILLNYDNLTVYNKNTNNLVYKITNRKEFGTLESLFDEDEFDNNPKSLIIKNLNDNMFPLYLIRIPKREIFDFMFEYDKGFFDVLNKEGLNITRNFGYMATQEKRMRKFNKKKLTERISFYNSDPMIKKDMKTYIDKIKPNKFHSTRIKLFDEYVKKAKEYARVFTLVAVSVDEILLVLKRSNIEHIFTLNSHTGDVVNKKAKKKVDNLYDKNFSLIKFIEKYR